MPFLYNGDCWLTLDWWFPITVGIINSTSVSLNSNYVEDTTLKTNSRKKDRVHLCLWEITGRTDHQEIKQCDKCWNRKAEIVHV